MKQLTEKQAIAFSNSKLYENMSHGEIARFQMTQDRLCVPFSIFHEAVEKTLGRPVFTHEFGLNREGLLKELDNGSKPPSLSDIMNMLPKDKTVIVLSQ